MSRAKKPAPVRLGTVPSLATVLSTLAGHVASIHTEVPRRTDAPYCDRVRGGCGLGGYTEGCPFVVVDWMITPSGHEGAQWDVWAQVTFTHSDGTVESCGNRYGGASRYAELCAPVVAWVADYWRKRKEDAA